MVYEHGPVFLSLNNELMVPGVKIILLAIPGKEIPKPFLRPAFLKGSVVQWWELSM